MNSDKIIKKIIEQVVMKKIKSNLIDKKDNLITLESLKKKFDIEKKGLVINNIKNIKDIFRYVENNNVVSKSVDILYKTFISNNISEQNEYEKCSGYELYIDPLNSIDIICKNEKDYDRILDGSSKIKNFINKYENEYVNIIKENDVSISFDFNINNMDDNYHTFILKVIPDMLNDIFSLCNNDIIPLQIRLVVYDRKDLISSEKDNILGYHRTFIVFKKFNNIYTGYYYDPEGNKNTYYTNLINELINKLNYKNMKIKPIIETCPIGIQSLLKDVDIGLCAIYSHFWYHCFIEVIYIIKKYDKKYGNKYNVKLHEIDISNYINYINKCIVDFSFKINLETYLDKDNNKKYSIIFKDVKDINKQTIINMFFNYAMYIIGFVFNKLSQDDENKLLKYIKLHDKNLVKI